jgi:acylphosphatase
MNKCLRITLQIKIEEGTLQNYIQKNAKKFNIEGIAQAVDKETIKIIACGESENIDKFVDSIYAGYKDAKPTIIEVEPFLKDKDYRGVFRLIE